MSAFRRLRWAVQHAGRPEDHAAVWNVAVTPIARELAPVDYGTVISGHKDAPLRCQRIADQSPGSRSGI
jgi:hypothetical protein